MSRSGQDAILVLNSGSSSLKAGLFVMDDTGESSCFAGEQAVLVAEASGIGRSGGQLKVQDGDGNTISIDSHTLGSQGESLAQVAKVLQQHSKGKSPIAVAHRIVHGGPHLREHTLLTAEVLAMLRQSIHFAPLHLPGSLELVEQAGKLYPQAKQVACFDTTFHNTMPTVARRLPVPQEFAAQGVERYGFHGLSYESLVLQLKAEPSGLPEKIVCAHLGGGSSLCAVRDGASVDTTMGLTPAGGVPMATRTGDIDPGVLFFLAREGKLDVEALEQLVNHSAGLAAISGGSGDMQQLQKVMNDSSCSAQEKADAALAFEIFAVAVAKAIASLTVSLGGLDLLVFAGGIGEHSAALRAAVVERLTPFGLTLDPAANAEQQGNIQATGSKAPIRILPAKEDAVIAMHARRLVQV